MARGEQIDKVSKMYVSLKPRHLRFAKKEHRKYLRKQLKNIEKPNPQYNRYRGWIG